MWTLINQKNKQQQEEITLIYDWKKKKENKQHNITKHDIHQK